MGPLGATHGEGLSGTSVTGLVQLWRVGARGEASVASLPIWGQRGRAAAGHSVIVPQALFAPQ